MEKTCFIIMPISDTENYAIGHFKRVYEYLIRPACMHANFKPVRADEILNTNYIAIDIIKRIINSDMAICDLSGRNPNVFYELGIRQAFNLPVTLIRDSLTERVFDIQGFRDIEYDDKLRIDNVDSAIEILAETLKNTYESKGQEVNSLVSLLGIQPAKINVNTEISKETELILNTLGALGSRLDRIENINSSKINEIPAFDIEETGYGWLNISSKEAAQLKPGEIIYHTKFGKGKVIGKEGPSHNPIIEVSFQFNGVKKLMTNYVNVKKLVKSE